MAGKKKEINLQMSISNDEQWLEMLEIKGLTVVDVFQQWCGPCRAVVSLFRKIKNELGDDLLHFAIAKADSIEALEKYRGKCEPTFLFYAGGVLVALLRGANAPLLQKMVVEELAKEKRVMEQGTERSVVKDAELAEEEQKGNIKAEQTDGDVTVAVDRSYTVAVIKPDAVTQENTNEIITKIQEAGFEILVGEERTLSASEAQQLYQHKSSEPYFDDLIQFMSSGPAHVLVLSKHEGSDVISAWQEFLGPADMEEAKRESPQSLRAQYGTENLLHALHGSRDAEDAGRELAFFFPNFRPAEPEPAPAERTLALIGPDAARENREEILVGIQQAGFTVVMQKEVTLTEEQVRRFYSQHQDEKDFPSLLTKMTSGPVLVLVLTKHGAVEHWRNLLGPSDPTQAELEEPQRFPAGGEFVNQLYGSESLEEAEREISFFFFPMESTLALIKPDTSEEHREEILREIRANGFIIIQQQDGVLTREQVQEFYREHRNQEHFSRLVDYMCRGPCTFLVLSKQNAVEDWRALMGPTDPSKAREAAPSSLRARFAKDVLENAVHGSSSAQHAQQNIQLIFSHISARNGDVTGEDEGGPDPLETEESFAELKNLQTSRSPSISEPRNQTQPSSEEPGGTAHSEETESQNTTDLPEEKEDPETSTSINHHKGEQTDVQGENSHRREDS